MNDRIPRSVAFSHMFFFFSSRRRHTRFDCDWSSDVCSSDLKLVAKLAAGRAKPRPGAAAPSDGVCIVAPGAEAEFLLQFALADLPGVGPKAQARRSEEHTSELQSQSNLVCRLLLEKKKKKKVQCTQSDRGD